MNISIEEKIQKKAKELGFHDCGFFPIKLMSKELEQLKNWFSSGLNADMKYMEINLHLRENPALLVENAKTIISFIHNYYPKEKQNQNTNYQISKYAYGKDYHKVIKKKLYKILNYINDNIKPTNGRAFTDSAPIFEKKIASESGLGWIGKNSLLINKKLGSFFFISELIVDIELKSYKKKSKNYCGKCNKCIEACPTDAIISPSLIDSKRCISYLTIENKNLICKEQNGQKWIFGCDICQDVCPWNSKVEPNNEPKFDLLKVIKEFDDKDWENLDEKTFDEKFAGNSIRRTGFEKLKKQIQNLKEKQQCLLTHKI